MGAVAGNGVGNSIHIMGAEADGEWGGRTGLVHMERWDGMGWEGMGKPLTMAWSLWYHGRADRLGLVHPSPGKEDLGKNRTYLYKYPRTRLDGR